MSSTYDGKDCGKPITHPTSKPPVAITPVTATPPKDLC